MNKNDNSIDQLVVEKNSKESPDGQGDHGGNFFKDILKFSLFALAIVAPIRIYVASPFIVSGASMDPSFETGHYLIVDQISYHIRIPIRGEVVVFRYPKDPSKFFIKRIIGLPGETVIIEKGHVSIESENLPEEMLLDEPYVTHTKDEDFIITLKKGEYFVMGDNRQESSDSRIWGPLTEDLITGRALVRLLPISKIDILPEQAKY